MDQAEAFLPGIFRVEYVRQKDKLISTHRSGYKVLATSFHKEGLLIEKYMPDILLAKAKSERNPNTETEKDKKIRILEQKLCALEKNEGASETTRTDKEENFCKYSLCKVHHYYQSGKGS